MRSLSEYQLKPALVGVLVGCLAGGCGDGGSGPEPGEPIPAYRVEIDTGGLGRDFGLLLGVSANLAARVLDRSGNLLVPQPEIEFTSTQPNKVAVTTAGRVTGVDLGWAWIHARVTGAVAARPDSVRVSVFWFASPRSQ